MNTHILIKAITFLSFIFFLFTTQSHGQVNSNKKNAERLIGTWTLDYGKTINGIKQTSKDYYDTLKAEKKKGIQASFEQRKMTFSQDGTYTLVVNSNRQVTGTWKLNNDDVTLEIVLSEGGKAITQTIERIDNLNLVLGLGNNGSLNSLFDMLYLNKVTN